eukprot:GHVN01005274.1.p2 GENE.GHVN01005274.1~~GHVN01005274.1.p2  ORF type:complete len:218 (+),score=22.04 GHVN01005274.1:1067-1720(+)
MPRRLLKVNGASAKKFLQGMTTQDISLCEIPKPPFALASSTGEHYTNISGAASLFLNAKGRILSSALVYKLPNERLSYLLDVPAVKANAVQEHLKKHTLREAVSMEDVTNQFNLRLKRLTKETVSEMDGIPRDPAPPSSQCSYSFFSRDPRYWRLGWRLYEHVEAGSDNSLQEGLGWVPLSLGVDEFVTEGGGAQEADFLPLNLNFDWLEHLCMKKG